MKTGIMVSTVLFVVGALLVLLQLWFAVWSPDVFLKLSITVGVFFLVSVVVTFVYKESAATQKLKSGNDL
jgi:hypothetical protein